MSTSLNELFMRRCLQLAANGNGYVAPNPMVGAVLVYESKIIGEGWHAQFGQAHAEVNCLNNVKNEDRHLIEKSTLYVSLEPCSHHGKTPPCAELIIKHKIPKVVIGATDSSDKVNGKGIQLLQDAGIATEVNVLPKECRTFNKFFYHAQKEQRPYILLKYAQSADGFIGQAGKRIALSNALSQRRVHQLRGAYQSILVGYHTYQTDAPQLNNRLGTSGQPIPIIIDHHLSIDSQQLVNFKGIIANFKTENTTSDIRLLKMEVQNALPSLLHQLWKDGIHSILIEGGSKTLQQFIDQDLWDEAYCIQTPKILENGIQAPHLKQQILLENFNVGTDNWQHYKHINNTLL